MTIAIEQMLMQITAFQFFFLSFFLFTYKKGHGTSNQLFALFLFSKGLLMSFNLLLEQRLLLINLLYFPTLFFYAPVLFLFINSKINKEFRFTPLMSLHLLPSLILFISNLLSQAAYLTLPQQYPTLVNLLYYVQAIIYTVLAITAIHNVKLVSTTKRLLKLLMAGFLLVMVIFATNFVMMILQLELPTLSNALVATGLCLLFLFANGIVYTTLRHPELFSDQSTASPAKILSLPKAVNEQTALKLKNLMEAEKLYLNPNLTLPEVADRMNLHQRTLSLVPVSYTHLTLPTIYSV